MTNTPTNLDELRAARTACDTGDADAFEKVLEVFPSLIEELDEARKELVRLRGFEPCAAMGYSPLLGNVRCSHPQRTHEIITGHDYLPGAFDDATKEGK